MIGQLFGKAWELYKRDVWWLILAGFIVCLAFVGAAAVAAFAVLAAMKAMGFATTGNTLGSTSGTSLVGIFGAAIVAYAVAVALASIFMLVFSGGLYQMVISAERKGCTAEIGDLFSGFRRIGAYAILWLCQVGVMFGVELVVMLSAMVLGPLAMLMALAGFCVMIWMAVSWVYAVVLISDRELGGLEALQESMRMVKEAGWWTTFGALVVLGIAFFLVAIVISFVSGDSNGVKSTLTFIFYVAAFPFSICYVAAMYIGSSTAPVTASYADVPAPPQAGGGYMPDAGYSSDGSPAVAGGQAAWQAAADPLAPPIQSLHSPAGQTRTVPFAPPAPPAAAPEPPAPPAADTPV